jgi:hypothetical protein
VRFRAILIVMHANADRGTGDRYGVLVRTVLITAVLAAACDSSSSTPGASDTPLDRIHAAVAAGPERSLDVRGVAYDYRQNPIDADRSYKGRVFRMQVVVNDIVLDRDGVPFVGLRSDHSTNRGADVACTFEDNKAQLSGLSPGSEIVVVGFGAGLAAGTPVFVGCKVEQRSWPKRATPPPSAEIGTDAYKWLGEIQPALNKASVKFKLSWPSAGHLWLDSEECDKAKMAIDALGKTPHGYSVICTVPGDLPSKAQWREENL